MTSRDVPEGRHRAGRMILAAADRDLEKMHAVMVESETAPGGLAGLCAALAGHAADAFEAAAGPDWRIRLVDGLLGMEVDGDD